MESTRLTNPGRRAVVILGMHRSGTSALAHALALRGLELPRTPMGPTSGNPRGHWGESARIHQLHDELLEDAGTAWDDPMPFPSGWTASAAGRSWAERMAGELAREYPGKGPFVFKDPRICRLVPFWLGVFEELGVEASFALPVRSPLEVADSLARRDELDQARALLLWLRHSIDAERETRGLARAFLSYPQLLGDWRSTLDSIAAAIDLEWPRSGPEADREIDEALVASERHHEVADTELAARADVAEWVKTTYGCLLEACRAGGVPDQGTLDAVGEALGQADLSHASVLLAERAESRERRARLEADLRALEERLAATEAARASAAERVDLLERQRDDLRDRLTAAEAEAARRGRERDEAEARLALARPPRPSFAERRRNASQLASWLVPPSPRGARMVREYLALRSSPHFNRAYYLRRNVDVANAGMDPVMHYVEHGAFAGLDPSPAFSSRAYLRQHPELVRKGINPLWHHIRHEGSSAPAAAAPAAPVAAPPASVADAPDPTPAALAHARGVVERRRPTVSVVVPTRDRAQLVRRAIRSALAQTYAPLEVIVSDDAGSDGTEEAVRAEFGEALAAGELIYLRSAERGGPSGARNRALAQARGDLVAYLDSDNAWHPDFLLLMAAALVERDDAATAYCGIVARDDRGERRRRGFAYDRDQLLIRNGIDLNAFVHRRRLFGQLGGFDEQLTRLVDWDLILRYTRNYPPVEVPYGLVEYDGGGRPDRVTHAADFESNATVIRRRFAHERAYTGHAPLRIGYVLWDYPALSQTFVLNEIRELHERGYDVHVYHHADPDRAARLDFDVPTFRVKDADRLADLLVRHGRTFLHSHFAYPAVTKLAWPAARKAGVPFTFMVHAVDVFHRLNVDRNRIAEITADELCARVFCYGEFHRAYLIDRGVPAEKISITRQAARLPLARGEEIEDRVSRPARVVATIARFVEKKGLGDLVRAAARLPEGTEVRLHGYGPLEEDLRALAAEVGAGRVRFMGPLESHDEVAAALREADVFALPCIVDEDGDMDGLPTVLGEAMAAGVPVVTTGVSAIPEVVAAGQTGFVATPGDPASLAERLGEALALDPAERRRLIDRARTRATEAWGVAKTADALLEVWERPPLDVVLVTHSRGEGAEAAATTTEILRRVFALATTPLNVTIVDNASDDGYRAALEEAVAGRANAALVTLDRNVHWGPAMNIALAHGRSAEVVYVCSREGFALRPGWERAFLEELRARQDVALAGHLIGSPAYPTGAAYREQPWFEGFRNKEFAATHPDREFRHVQGGLFAIRRAAFDRCGGFSTLVSQEAVDVEYSYYVESLGWKLGRVPRIPSVTRKTRPEIHAHLDEHTLAAHPLTLESLEVADALAGGEVAFCNLCAWSGDAFRGAGGVAECPHCGSTPFGRLAFRYLAETSLPYRGLRCGAAIRDEALREQLARMFAISELAPETSNGASGDHLDVVVADLGSAAADDETSVRAAALAKALAGPGTVIAGGIEGAGARAEIERILAQDGFTVEWRAQASEAVRFDPGGLLVAARDTARVGDAEPAHA